MPCLAPLAMLRPFPLALLGLALAVGCGGEPPRLKYDEKKTTILSLKPDPGMVEC